MLFAFYHLSLCSRRKSGKGFSGRKDGVSSSLPSFSLFLPPRLPFNSLEGDRHSQALDRTARLAKGSELASGGRRENYQEEEEDELFKDERKAALSKRSQFVLQ